MQCKLQANFNLHLNFTMNKKLYFAIITIMLLSAASIEKFISLDYPKYFPKPKYNFKNNPLQQAKIELGRMLFYDPILSKDSTISCASCHSPFNAFAHTDHDLSHGIHDQIGTRNAPALFNLAWQNLMMWDGAINHLDVQALAPISHPKEMNENINSIVEKLNHSLIYKKHFSRAFQDSIISGEKVLKALSQFQLTLISSNSKYDIMKLKKMKFTEQEQHGYDLFKQKCNQCHTEPLFSSYTFANNGLNIDTTLNDYGRTKITTMKEDSFLFKIPSLRNLSFTYPYMHDGRFKRLSEVLNHYNNLNINNKFLSKELKQNIQLSSNDKADLIAFLFTLNDSSFVFNSKFQHPKNYTEGF